MSAIIDGFQLYRLMGQAAEFGDNSNRMTG